ncbi:hypothetical protein ACE7GA_21315 [Roseomonas sp. CCTCC AB2023176]|uniref:hypothetical protein n=1 Tax=Roseomonas sp. CCTCC AB2023176 TaxID=3342640 RepID=UPI0035D9235E
MRAFGIFAVLMLAGCAASDTTPMPPLAGVRCPAAGTAVTYSSGSTGWYQGEDPADPGVCLYTSPRGERQRYLGVLFQVPRLEERQTRVGLAPLFPLAVGKEATWRGALRPQTPGTWSAERGIPTNYRARVVEMRNVNIGSETRRAYAVEVSMHNLPVNSRQSYTVLIDERTGVDLGSTGAEDVGGIARVAPYHVVRMGAP